MSCLNVDPIGLVDRAIRQSALTHGIQGRLLLAISGGLDSMVLLDALARARDLGVIPRLTLHAVHVHHGLSENADDWMSHVRRECQKRDVSFQGCRVTLQKNAQESLEELARHARYNAFAEVLTQSSSHLLVLAHHMDDQAETLLLQLLRGAGPRGLSGMAEYPSSPTKLCIWRPLISVSRKDLLNYSNARNISFVHDESNEHLHFKRNFLRHRVFPVIEEAFPAYRKTFAR
ncbi:MAG: tRNA lysidine(34) synthetase TilS, partial [Burkholderiales bacterium]|nr:tRNA lysidine(34) synthetase TilS [Burkholderiales bacterium]